MMSTDRIFVENEFAPLKKVVLPASEFGYPLEVRQEDLRFLDESSIEDSFTHRGKDFKEAHPIAQLKWELERSNFKKVLQGHGVEVIEARGLTDAEKKFNSKDGYPVLLHQDICI